ncbi:MAG: hypothetical protein SO099_00690, partial [Ruthenibacterium lactatiformans]|nr:hypothetical protein [Ruthenibacterium lactatiformans]MDY4943618.1 hypothetical protein [Ruthenibacterium lactatiformans]
PVPIYTPLPWPGENFPQPDIGAVCPFSGNGAEMQRNTGYFPTESLEPCGNRLFSRSALNEGYLFRGSLVFTEVALPSGSSEGNFMWVQVPSSAPGRSRCKDGADFLYIVLVIRWWRRGDADDRKPALRSIFFDE